MDRMLLSLDLPQKKRMEPQMLLKEEMVQPLPKVRPRTVMQRKKRNQLRARPKREKSLQVMQKLKSQRVKLFLFPSRSLLNLVTMLPKEVIPRMLLPLLKEKKKKERLNQRLMLPLPLLLRNYPFRQRPRLFTTKSSFTANA